MATPADADRRGASRFWLLLAGVALACLAVPVVWLVIPRSFRGETVPDPNGYDDLVAAARAITGQSPSKPAGQGRSSTPPAEATVEELRAFVGPNAGALARAKVGLGRASCVRLPSGVPLDKAFAAIIDDMSALRELGRLLACAAALDEREGRTAEAAEGYAGVIRLGHAAGYGGLMIDKLVEPAIQWQGVDGLNRLAPSLSSGDARRLAAEAERVERAAEPVARVAARDRAFAHALGGWRVRAMFLVQGAALRRLSAPAEASAERGDKLGRARLRLLATTLALRAYHLDHPDAPTPTSLDALVPAYLRAVPDDPFGKGPLKLRPRGDNVLVYSVGQNGRDDGGAAPASPRSGDQDLLLGAP